MIIDIHYHVLDNGWMSEGVWDMFGRIYAQGLKALGMEMTLDDVKRNILASLWDPYGEKLIAEMDEAGIDKTVILPQDFGLAMGESRIPVEEQNKAYAELQKRYPDRIIAFATVDPRRPGAVSLIERCIGEWGLKGVKLHPGAGYYPDARECYRLLAKINELGVPVLTHSGFWPWKSKTCDPIHWDDILVDFPNLVVIAAHLGRGWQNVLNEMGVSKFNLFTDFSGWQVVAQQHYGEFCENLRQVLNYFGTARVLFGTDGPFLRMLMTNKDYVQLIRDLPDKSPEGISFTKDEVDSMLGKGAAALFGL